MRPIRTLAYLAILIMTNFVTVAHAGSMGGNGGGGGDEVVARFVSGAYELLRKVPFSPEHKQWILDGLIKSDIGTAAVLKNENGDPVPDQDQLVAYAWRGKIQLKYVDSGSFWAKRYQDNPELAKEIIHELLRASGQLTPEGKSVDHTFQISEGIYHLEKFASARLQTRAVARIQILRDSGWRYCGSFKALYGSGYYQETESQCLNLVENEVQLLYSFMRPHIGEDLETVRAEYYRKSNQFCERFSNVQTRASCADVMKTKRQLLDSLVSDLTPSDILEILGPEVGQKGKIFGDALVLYSKNFDWSCRPALSEYMDLLVKAVAETAAFRDGLLPGAVR